MLTINLEFDAEAQADAPASFFTGVEQAADILEAAIDDPITVNITVGYGEYDLGGPDYTPLTDDSLGGVADSIEISYSALRTALAASDPAAAGALPDTAALNGQTEFFLSGAQAKALGALPATDTAIDGYIGFPTSFSGATLVQAGIDEILHAMGMLTGDFPLALVEYTSPGNHYLTDGPSSAQAYFSLDGGVTDLADYDTSFDPTLFANLPNDPLSAPAFGVTTLTPLDLSEISAIGFDTTSTPALPTPNIVPTVTAAGSENVVEVQDVTVAPDATIAALSMITGASEPSGEPIVNYGFDDQGGSGSGYFEIGGAVEPDNQWFYVLDTQLSALQYVGGTTPGLQDIEIDAFNYPTGPDSQISSLDAVTTTTLSPAAAFWTDPTTGDTGYWAFDPSGDFAGSVDLGDSNTSYTAVGVGDFAGNGQSEVLWENETTGDTGFWTTDAADQVTGFDDFGSANTAYSIAGIGDFDASGETQVLWEDGATGDTGYWTISDGAVTGFNNLGAADTAYSVVGVGDFDGSGHDEVLWEDEATGDTGYWTTNAQGQVTGFDDLGQASTAYSSVGVGDFDGSGHDEVLWEDKSTGDIGYWTTSGGQVTGFHDFGFADTAYAVAGVADYAGTGNDTVLWADAATGDAGYWTLSAAGQVTGFHDLGDIAAAGYHVVPA